MTGISSAEPGGGGTISPPLISRSAAVIAVIVALIGLLSLTWSGRAAKEGLVVYCAHDSVYSEEVLRDFERETGIPVEIRFDTEATKSTMTLKEQGVLEAYKGSGYERIPEGYRDPDGFWAGFGARLRVYLVNTDQMPASDVAIESALNGELSRVAVAQPLYGTTLTHYSVLWDQWGEDRLKQWHADSRQRGVVEVKGNSVVKNLVAAGKCDVGWTDTDDFFLAVDDEAPVEMRPIRAPSGETICIPNSVAIVKNCRHRKLAERLVDYLLSAETELRLAKSRSRQVPLGPVDESQLPREVQQLRPFVGEGVELYEVADAHRACLEWLQAEYSE
ncbi:MAG: substrate-binding domain-containing protein [Planctomycetota bacterium]|jgi:iron(III) transport system substrate-binding protein